MLVVSHQQKVVSGCSVGAKVPVGIIEGHRLRQDPAPRTEGRMKALHEQMQVCLRGSGHLFKVYADSGKLVLTYETDQRIDQARP